MIIIILINFSYYYIVIVVNLRLIIDIKQDNCYYYRLLLHLLLKVLINYFAYHTVTDFFHFQRKIALYQFTILFTLCPCLYWSLKASRYTYIYLWYTILHNILYLTTHVTIHKQWTEENGKKKSRRSNVYVLSCWPPLTISLYKMHPWSPIPLV